MNVVWYRLRVSEFQRHTHIKIFPSTPPGTASLEFTLLTVLEHIKLGRLRTIYKVPSSYVP